jgi:dienelactone hydrolase
MKRLFPFLPALLACSAVLVPSMVGAGTNPEELKLLAMTFVDRLSKRDFVNAANDFDAAMQSAMPIDKLEETWVSLDDRVGAFQKQTGARFEPGDKYDIVYVTCAFERLAIDAKVVFSKDKKITGLFFSPAKKPPSAYQPPDYVKPSSFQETSVKVGSGEWELPGSLTMPLGNGPFPAVVLVHGSGPNDRDETVGANRPFRDLAWGLASQGIAVLRYEKRTKEHAGKLGAGMEGLTIKEEVLDDALAAVALLQKTPKVDPHKVFVLGHSLGAMYAPKLATMNPGIAGLIVLAGTTRPLEDVIVAQLDYLLSLNPAMAADQKKSMEDLKVKALTIRLVSKDTPASSLPFSVPATYWLSLRDYNAPEVAKALRQPMLILQGERDYQVTMQDFQGWKKALSARSDVVLKSYPKLNHLFIEGEGKSQPGEYEKEGHVARYVIQDVAEWIKKH